MNIVVYSKPACPNCETAKHLLGMKKLEYVEYNLDDPEKLAEFCAAQPGVRQMPQIYINGQRVGGVAGLVAALGALGL